MSDNDEFNIPFERAFKRLRVDGEMWNEDLSDNEDYLNDHLSIKTKSSLNKISNNVPSNCTNSMWRSSDCQKQFDKSIKKSSFNSDPHHHLQTNDKNKVNLDSKCNFLLNDLKKTRIKSASNGELAPQNCSNQARSESDISVVELAAYLDCQLFLPKKMSFMAELAYS